MLGERLIQRSEQQLKTGLKLLRGVELTEEQRAAIFANSLNLEDPQDEVARHRDEAVAATMFDGLGVQVQRPDRVIRLAGITRLEALFGEESAQKLVSSGDVRDWMGHPVRVMDPDDYSETDKVAIRDHFGLVDGVAKPVQQTLVERAMDKIRKAREPQIPATAYVLTHGGDSFLIVPQRSVATPTPNPTIKP